MCGKFFLIPILFFGCAYGQDTRLTDLPSAVLANIMMQLPSDDQKDYFAQALSINTAGSPTLNEFSAQFSHVANKWDWLDLIQRPYWTSVNEKSSEDCKKAARLVLSSLTEAFKSLYPDDDWLALHQVRTKFRQALFSEGGEEVINGLIADDLDSNMMYCSDSALGWMVGVRDRISCARELIRRGADVNFVKPSRISGDKEDTILMRSLHRNIDLVREIIAKGAEVNSVGSCGRTALHNAVEYLPLAAFDLLDAGASGDTQDRWMRTPLLASIPHSPDIALELIARGVPLNVKCDQGKTPLMVARLHNQPLVYDELRFYGVDFDAEGKDKELLMGLACGLGNHPLVSALITEGVDVNCVDSRGATPLLRVCNSLTDTNADGVKQLISLLIQNGADVNWQGEKGQAAVRAITSYSSKGKEGAPEVLRLVLENGADPDIRSIDQKTPLMWAINPKLLDVLLAYGADINAQDKDGKTALYLAVAEHFSPPHYFLSKGADPNIASNDGYTPLFFAVVQARCGLVDEMLKVGANPRSGNDRSEPVLEYACGKNHYDNVKQQVELDKSVAEDQREKIVQERLPLCAEALLKAGADPMPVNTNGFTPLAVAVEQGYLPTVRVLLKYGASPNAVSRGTSVFYFASKKDPIYKNPDIQEGIIEALIDYGLDFESNSSYRSRSQYAHLQPVRARRLSQRYQNMQSLKQSILKADTSAVTVALGKTLTFIRTSSPNITFSSGESPLWLACNQRYSQRPKRWSTYSPNGATQGRWVYLDGGRSSGLWSDKRLSAVSVFLLLKSGADPNQKSQGDSVIGLAVRRGDLPMVNHLLKSGADPAVKLSGGAIALHVACRAPEYVGDTQAAIVQRLIDAKSDVRARDDAGQTARDIALIHKQRHLIGMLRDAEDQPRTLLINVRRSMDRR